MSLKILHLSSERFWRGGEQQIAYLVQEGENRGFDVSIAARKGSEVEKYAASRMINHYALPFSNSMDIRSAILLKKICRELKPDLLHLHSSKSHGIAVLSAVMGNKVPMVLSRRVNFPPKDSWFTRYKYNHPSVKKIICVSEKVNNYIKGYIKDPEKSLTIYSGIDIGKFASVVDKNVLRDEYKLDPNIFIIGTVAALEQSKDLPTFIKAIRQLKDRSLKFMAFIIGSGSLQNELKSLVNDLQLDDVIKFTGFRKDIVQVIASLDAFLLTSKEEGLGSSILDAFAARVPVVATAAGGIPEMVINNETGVLAPIGDSNAVATGIQLIIENRPTAQRFTNNAFQRLSTTFSKEEMARKTFEVYREVSSAKR